VAFVATDRQLADVLSEFARTVATDFPIQGILDHLVRRIVDILPVTGAGVTLISPTTAPHDVAASDEAALRFVRLQSEIGEGPCLSAYRSGEAVVIPDLRATDDFKEFGPRALEAGLGAVFSLPLRNMDGQLGALDLYRGAPGDLTPGDMEAAQTLADVTAAYLANAQARSELQDASEQFHTSALHDALTGLPNRLLLLERLEHALLRAGRLGHPVAILFVDLDRFKAVNDNHGHLVGDDLLVAVAQRMSGLIRPGDTLARLSGDEFVIVCEAISEKLQVHLIASRIVEALASPFPLDDVVVEMSASVGIAFSAEKETDPEQLLREADIAMYQAKRRGGGTHQVIDVREQSLAERMVTLQRDLLGAEERGEFRTEYQPIVRTHDGRIFGVEALLRWDHPTHGLIPPTTLIPLAEQSGSISDIGRWVMARACPDRRRWAIAGCDHEFGMSVNISAQQLLAPDFVGIVSEVLIATGTPPGLLTLEITEVAFVQDPRRASVVLTDLKELGVLLALDDFGTGYSSLNYLKQFPVDILKIDRTFTADLIHDHASHAIVTKIIELAHMLDLAVVTEGVETAAQRAAVSLMGSEFYQGYYFARPMSAEGVDGLLSRRAPARPMSGGPQSPSLSPPQFSPPQFSPPQRPAFQRSASVIG
jgi:diguanylate cyclase (GGDEF)-like protein